MNCLSRWSSFSLAILLGAAVSVPVYATNGMFLIASGTKSRGMGGVSMTLAHDTLTSAINPATLVYVEGNRFDIGGDIFVPQAEATLGGSTVESTPKHMTVAEGVYMMPNIGASWNAGDFAYGFTMVGVGGGGSKYDFNLYNAQTGGQPTNVELGVSLIVMQINPTVAMKLNDTHSVGVTLIMGMQVFKAFGLSEFQQFTTSGTASQLTDQGSEVTYGAGIRLGWLGSYMADKLRLGFEYTSQVDMKRFEDYSELFAENGDFNTPGNYGVGISYKFSDNLTTALDIQYVLYEDVAAISNLGPNTSGGLFPVDKATNALGADEGLGFGWENQTVYKLGLEYQYSDVLTLRGGWNYGKSPINEDREIIFNIVAPATVQHHMTLGGTYKLDKETEFSISYVHAFKFTQAGPTYIGGAGEISMSQDSIGMTLSSNF